MLSVKTLLNLKRLALKNVSERSLEYYIEKCYRHYSTTYFTPLHEAKKIVPIEEAILIYLEDEFNELTAEEVADLRTELSTRDQPIRSDSEYVEEDGPMSDEEWIAQQNLLLDKKKETKPKQEKNLMEETHAEAQKLMQELRGSMDILKNLGKD